MHFNARFGSRKLASTRVTSRNASRPSRTTARKPQQFHTFWLASHCQELPAGVLVARRVRTKGRQSKVMRAKPFSNARGYSIIQLLITLAVAMMIAGFAIVASRALATRLDDSARSSRLMLKGRGRAVRRHSGADCPRRTIYSFT
jgi:hypothetical protein